MRIVAPKPAKARSSPSGLLEFLQAQSQPSTSLSSVPSSSSLLPTTSPTTLTTSELEQRELGFEEWKLCRCTSLCTPRLTATGKWGNWCLAKDCELPTYSQSGWRGRWRYCDPKRELTYSKRFAEEEERQRGIESRAMEEAEVEDLTVLARERQRAAQEEDKKEAKRMCPSCTVGLDNEEVRKRLSQPPPIPTVDHSIDKVKAAKWVNAWCRDIDKKAAQLILDKTRYVSFEEFKATLFKAVEMMMAEIGPTPSPWVPAFLGFHWHAAITPIRGYLSSGYWRTSNFWVLQLVLEVLFADRWPSRGCLDPRVGCRRCTTAVMTTCDRASCVESRMARPQHMLAEGPCLQRKTQVSFPHPLSIHPFLAKDTFVRGK